MQHVLALLAARRDDVGSVGKPGTMDVPCLARTGSFGRRYGA